MMRFPGILDKVKAVAKRLNSAFAAPGSVIRSINQYSDIVIAFCFCTCCWRCVTTPICSGIGVIKMGIKKETDILFIRLF